MENKLLAWVVRRKWFLLFVIVPVSLTSVYYGLIASDQYVSESRFVIKNPNQRGGQLSTFANLIQTTGLSAGQEQANEVIDYIRSRTAIDNLRARNVDVRTIFSAPEADFLAAYPYFWRQDLNENLFRYYRSKVEVGLDHETGLVVLRVTAFSAKDAQELNQKLLELSEELVNELNDRARTRAISEAEKRVQEAQGRVAIARRELTRYRNASLLIDPAKQATDALEVANRLITERAAQQAQLELLQRVAPANPGIPAVRNRISALTSEIEKHSARVVGGDNSIARKLPPYESLALDQEFSVQLLSSATASLESARAEAVRQQYYLERVVNPGRPDLAEHPQGIRIVLTVLGALLCLYFIAWMFIVGILEHAPED